MYKLLTKNGQLFALILGVGIIVIFFVSVFGGLSSAGYSTSDDLNAIMKGNPDADFSFFNVGIMAAAGLAIAALAAAVIFGLIQLLSNPKGSIKGILAIVGIGILFFALYSTATSDMEGSSISNVIQQFDVSENVSKMISGGIKTTAILAAASMVIMVLFEIRNLFK